MTLLPVASSRAVRAELARALRPVRLPLVVSGLLLLVGATGRILALILLGDIVDVVAAGDGGALATLLIALTIAIALGVLFEWRGGRRLADVLIERTAVLRERVMAAALGRRAAELEAAGSGDVLARVSEDTTAVGTAASRMLPSVVSAALTTLVTVSGVAVLDLRLALSMLIALPLHLVTMRWFLRRSAPVYRSLKTSTSHRSQRLVEGLLGAAALRALRAERPWSAAFSASSAAVLGREREAARVRAGFGAGLNGAELLGLLGVLGVGFLLEGADLVTIGAVAAAALCFHNLFGPIGALLASVDELQNAGASLARLTGVLEGAGESAARARPDANTPASVRMRGVRHGYSAERESVRGVDIDIPARAVVAVIGLSGAGKSTLAKLVSGVLEPTAGRVHVTEGAAVAMVSQEFHVFRGTVWDNLRLARADAGDASLRASVDRLGASWVHDLPEGGSTVVGEGGHPLTAAQAQHLALVRVDVAGPDVVVLDEATSEADSADARALDDAIRRLLEGRTALLVAHRLEQCALADTILYLADGQVVEQGGHDELLARDGAYARLWDAAARVADDDAEG